MLFAMMGAAVHASTNARILRSHNLEMSYRSLVDEGEFIGIHIMSVKDEGLADIMGLRVNDIFLGLGNQPITAESIKKLGDYYEPGENVLIRVQRGRHQVEFSIKMPDLDNTSSGSAFLGVETSESKVKDVVGTKVEKVISGSAAAYAGLKRGDVILGVENQPVVSNLTDILSNRAAGELVHLRVQRGRKQIVIPVILGKIVEQKAV